MPKDSAKVDVTKNGDNRALPRKTALLNAVIAGRNGENPVDCLILDINARSAQITVSDSLRVGMQVYLLDPDNKLAHLARVVRCRGERAGLQFIQTHVLGMGLAPNVKFLWRLFLEAKFREVYRLVTTGVPLELALSTAGVDEDKLRQMARYVSSDKRFEILFRLGRHARKRLPRLSNRRVADRNRR
jgi:hypothetical protein